MTINPPEAAALATIYRLWERSQRTSTFERLGDALAVLAARMGGWPQVHQLCADCLSTIPTAHLKLAFADHVRRVNRALSN